MINKEEFRDLIRDIVREELGSQARYKIGTIASPSGSDGKPTVIFAGESQPSGKGYSHLSSYSPASGDRVLLARTKGTYVILGDLITPMG